MTNDLNSQFEGLITEAYLAERQPLVQDLKTELIASTVLVSLGFICTEAGLSITELDPVAMKMIGIMPASSGVIAVGLGCLAGLSCVSDYRKLRKTAKFWKPY